MKYTSNIVICFSLILAIAMVSFSCEDRLGALYDNPNAVTSIDDAALFTKAVRSLFLETTSQSASRFAGHYGHYFVAGSTARIPDQYGDGFDVNYNEMFTGLFSGTIRHIEEVLHITAGQKTKNEVRHAMADVIAVLGYAKLTDAYGDIPYFQGGKGKTEGILLPVYDTQESIYVDFISRLTASISVLQGANPSQGYPGSDPVFGNDLSRWVRFANSVRLRLAMRLRYAKPELSKATVAKCLAVPLMEENDHNAWIIQTEGNGNPWYTKRTGFPSIKMSVRLIDQLKATNDPRLPVFVSPDENGEYTGMVNGLDDTAFGNSNYAAKSDIGIAISSRDSKIYLITAAETWLLRAEAALVYDNDPGGADALYRKGVETALTQWDIDPEMIADFMASEAGSLQGNNDEKKIGTQMWLALIPNYFEGWNYIRRTGYPLIPVRMAENLSPGVTGGVMPARFLYSSFELSSNTTNVQAAISRQGPNKIDTPLWWDKNE